ncbi:hypothetical protein SSX86_002805 [Deinandra increscens subsp. villosa]|uniref:RING-type domain-containing protein n=1 Tax=Deinandra increscens subsp. villosa TaxID=3103831 RepID=A0AAP0HBN4_9ASTR
MDAPVEIHQGSDPKSSLLDAENQHGVICAICLDEIPLQESSLVKGCEHAYCVICILRWAESKNEPTCPQCKNPFEFLIIHRSLDGSIHDYMFEESVCLLLRASWFDSTLDDFYRYMYGEEDDEDPDEVYLNINNRIGNRRRGNNGSEKQEARPGHQQAGSSSGEPKGRDLGRRAKRTLRRKAAQHERN